MAKKKMRKSKRVPWNKGVEVGPRAAFTAAQVTRIRKKLEKRGDVGLKHLALLSTALDTMLRSPDLLALTVKDVRKRTGEMRDTFKLASTEQRPVPIQCTLSAATMSVLEKVISETGKKQRDYLFTGRIGGGATPLSARQLSRIVKGWVADVGLNEDDYGIQSLRRTGAIAMQKRRPAS